MMRSADRKTQMAAAIPAPERKTHMTAEAATPAAGQENTDDFLMPERRIQEMTAATPAAGQENKDDSCYSCCLPREYRRHYSCCRTVQYIDDSCYSCCRTGKHKRQPLLLLRTGKHSIQLLFLLPDRRTQIYSCYAVGQENTR